MKTEALLWTGILLGPVGWFLSLEANFALAPLACYDQAKFLLHLVSGVAFLLVFLAGSLSFTQFQTAERNVASEPSAFRSRRRGMALAGMGLSGLFLLVIVAQAIPNFLLAGCE
jgi:hypothetical protein